MDILGRDGCLSQTFYVVLALLVALPVLVPLPVLFARDQPGVDRWLGKSEGPPVGLVSDERQESGASASLHL